MNSRAKGASFERAIVAEAIRHGFTKAHRTAPMQAGHSPRYPDVGGVGPLWIEAKAYAKNVPANMVTEGLREKPGYVPCVVWKTNRVEPRVTLLFSDLLKLMTNPPRSREEAERSLLGDYVVDITKALRDSGLAPDGPWKQYARPSRDGEGGE